MIGSFILSRDSKVMRFEPEVDIQFSLGSSTSTEYVKMTELLKLHSPLVRVQVHSVCCALSIQIKERPVTKD